MFLLRDLSPISPNHLPKCSVSSALMSPSAAPSQSISSVGALHTPSFCSAWLWATRGKAFFIWEAIFIGGDAIVWLYI